ncbi:uncharacterized protein LOC117175816 isoform X1 [Belonocnema kinseyi]|uniref:uncharacterized protein LOC117175816 isoform X1 n=1 Tax=Belonocnema kinseyi TaxID=2817044 RepID=UPI00143DE5C6|nr:uncharacterized protein LOC117175816 isoform X1 [Belonocnema kinseyi]
MNRLDSERHQMNRLDSERHQMNRLDSDRHEMNSSPLDDDDIDDDEDVDGVNILDTLPLEGAPIEGQEVSEADLLGKSISKDLDDDDENEMEKSESGDDEVHEGSEGNKRHADSDSSESAKKKQKMEEENEDSESECETKAEKKLANMRRNIREVMDETQLDEATLSAQRQEMERLRRVQEQQRIIREVQRQMAINRQNNKTQTRVMSILQGKQNLAGTTISQSSPSSSSQVRLPSTVLLKVNSGSGAGSHASISQAQSGQMRRPIGEMKWQRGRGGPFHGAQTSISRVPNRASTGPSMLQQRIRMMTPSVSISPVVPKKEPIDREYYSDSDMSDAELDEALREKQMHAMRKMSSATKPPKPAKGKDVVTISSSSESSDDDCIVLSDRSAGEETDNDDDPANSGMHTNDRYNVPDEHGRVLINVGHPESEPDVFLAPQVARIIKPHQIGGIRFLFDNIVESIDRYKTSSGFGCILAHSMGLGKTLQVASFCDIFFRCTTARTVLCIMPINTLQNWLAEFNMWLPYEDPNAPKQEPEPIIKSEPGTETKHEVKEEGSQSDMSSASESANRMGQDGQNIMHENAFQSQGFDAHNMMGYPSDGILDKGLDQNPINQNPLNPNPLSQNPLNHNFHGDMSQNAVYGNFNPMPRATIPGSNFGLENQAGNMYPGMENQMQSSMYPGMENRPGEVYPGVDPSMDPSINSSIYPPYGNPAQHYPNYDPSAHKDAKKDDVNIKKEPEEAVKKEESTNKEFDEKQSESVKTPFSVDAPAGLEIRPRHFRLHILNDSHKTMAARARVIQDWQKNGGVLLIGYELYRQLSLKKANKAKRKRGQPFKDPVDVEEDDKNKGLLDGMHTALVSPGPDLVICDEGHRIKNSHASISLALKQMRTKRRIVLTGYPLQNNLLEYWCMVDFVRPNYLGTKSEFCNMFERPIQNGQCIDSTPQDIRLMRYRAHVLHALLEGFVQRRSHSVLQISLPQKEEYILLVRMTPHQRKLYDTFMNQVVKTRAVPNPLKAFAVCCKIWNHPDILYHFLRKRQVNEEDDLDLEETIGEKVPPGGAKRPKARQPKGEGKKGKKATVKNKPAASVQPNSSSTTSAEPAETDTNNPGNSTKSGNYQNFPAQKASPGFPSTGNSNSFPGYQNYPQNEQGNYYRNDNSQEFNEFYNNQGQQQQQQRYGNQNFQQYPQTSDQGYNNPSQNYPNQNYIAGNDQPGNQNQGSNYEASGIFPRQNYPYQDPERNYPTMNQEQNYPQVPNQSANFQPAISDYSSYPGGNQGQGYVAGSTQNYGTNQQSGVATPSQGFNQNPSAIIQNQRPYPANQQNSNLGIQNMGIQNQAHYSQNQMAANTPSLSPALGFGANQSTNPLQNLPPNQMHYGPNQGMGQNSGISQSQGSAQNPGLSQNPGISQNPVIAQNSGITQNQGLPQNQISYPASQTTNPTSQNPQIHGYQNHIIQSRSSAPASSNLGYQTPGSAPGQIQGHRYPLNQQNQAQNQSLTFPPTQQTQNPVMSQNEQIFSSPDNQKAQNYVSTPTACQTGTSTTNPAENYPANQAQASSSSALPGDPFWQQNYSQDQCNDPYFRESSVNRYPNNYFPQQNYPNQSFEYSGNRSGDVNSRTDESKASSAQPGSGIHMQGQGVYEKGGKDGVQNQPLMSNNPGGRGVFNGPDSSCRNSMTPISRPMGACLGNNAQLSQGDSVKDDEKEKEELFDKEKEEKSDEEILAKDEEKDPKSSPGGKEEPGIPYDWATELMKGYVPGLIESSAKMSLFFCILEEAIRLEDRVLAFSQSLFTLNLIEDFLARNNFKYLDGTSEAWVKNVNYYRLDGSTSALEREKLINEFNVNPKIHLFLVSTRAGSLGINLVGANRAIVFDASWNPCHDTQAVCRVYRYGQKKRCFVYRLVTDNCLERKIYDRQISKQGMADRVVDQCNPDAHLSLKEATTLSWDWEEDSQVQDFSQAKGSYSDEVMHKVLQNHSSLLTKQPFHHESLLVDRKDKKLSQAEKRLARRGYELEKMAATCSRPSYSYVPGNTATRAGGLQIRAIRGAGGGGGPGGGGGGGGIGGLGGGALGDMGPTPKPVASVRPMQQRGVEGIGSRGVTGSRWIPAEVWQRQGMSAQEMTLPLDVVIPTNSPDKGSIVLKAGQRVMVLKSPKGIYMQLESGKIIAIRTALKLNQQKRDDEPKKDSSLSGLASMVQRNSKAEVGFPLRNNSAISIIPKSSSSAQGTRPPPKPSAGPGYRPFADKEMAKRSRPIATATAKPYLSHVNITNQVSLSRLPRVKQEPMDHSSLGENSNSSDGPLRTDQRVEEVRLEDVVAEVSSNEYSRPNRPLSASVDSSSQKSSEGKSQPYPTENVSRVQSVQIQRSQQPELSAKVDKPVVVALSEAKEVVGQPDSSSAFKGNFTIQKSAKESLGDEISLKEPARSGIPAPIPSQPLVSPIPPPSIQSIQPAIQPSIQPQQPPQQRSMEVPNTIKNLSESSNSPAAPAPVIQGAPPAPLVGLEQGVLDAVPQPDPHGVPQGYPYAQYPRYYDYADPRSRSLGTPYGGYFPGVPPHVTNPRQAPESVKPPGQTQADLTKPVVEETGMISKAADFVPTPSSSAKATGEVTEPKTIETAAPTTTTTTTAAATAAANSSSSSSSSASANREESHTSTAFTHPTAARYPAPYPPGPYDPYAQHYPPAPGPSATYPPGGAPGYPTYGGPSYNADYARMYSAFHGPPPAADPYMHRGYAPPPATHPPGYYPPFPHPPPPYPNYSFLPPYPNPNMPSEPQPPAQ